MKLSKFDLEGKIVDIHTHSTGIYLGHLFSGKNPIVQDIVDLSNIISKSGVDYAVTFPIPFSIYYDANEYFSNGIFKPSNYCDFPFQYENEAMCKLIKEYRLNNLLPFLSVSTADKVNEQIIFLEELINKYDIYGIKYHSTLDKNNIDNENFELFAMLAEKYNLPIMAHTKSDGYANPQNVIEFAKKHKNIRICAAHCARLEIEFFSHVNNYDNIFVDCCPFLKICNIYKEIKSDKFLNLSYNNPNLAFFELFSIIEKKLLWATDKPWNTVVYDSNISSYKDEVELLKKNCLSDKLSINNINYLFGV